MWSGRDIEDYSGQVEAQLELMQEQYAEQQNEELKELVIRTRKQRDEYFNRIE